MLNKSISLIGLRFNSINFKFKSFNQINKPFQLIKLQHQKKFISNNFNNNIIFKRFNSSLNSNNNLVKKSGLKSLIQQYGYSALGIYFVLSCIDFPICFIIVHSVGVDKVKEFQSNIWNDFKKFIGYQVDESKDNESKDNESKDNVIVNDNDIVNDNNANNTNNDKSIWLKIWESELFTEAIVAYALHKSLIFIRLPITAAITPSIVGKLKKLGFNIGKQKLSKNFGTSATKRQKWWSWFF
ncbi:hypothetical protein WICMUC_005746 [Wickerhamomyces mucosus]|uniref:DUF1279 domain-containing protein n=1 Tax=Wickerhamomyces mucosus TaxID=1378264 RepID=A0A9P8P3H2_9ASCO|nr:hypothetical protein WICMUC_005746 [Wickerhamomyces mucosus]